MPIALRLLGGLLLALVLLLPAPEGQTQGYAPDEAVRRMRVADGFVAHLVASEPAVRQPVAIEFDERGRLWVVQYLQYPNPAGLKRVRVDRFSRTVYDRVPAPPPKGPRGADRISILEAPDATGRFRRAKDFVTGLNLASGLAFGHGGVYVLQAPYLLFYPDRDGDVVPDGDPEVLLEGFGMEDASSVANSLTWGPDGWLYGCQGSTVTARVRGIEFQQGVWRYHPGTRRFELFCEGGGNCWGLDFDARGNLFYSTNHGGYVAVHGVQGGSFWKQFGKHGPLHNPHAYGHLEHMPHRNFRGGHVTVGGIVYQGGAFPPRFRGKYIAADLLGHALYWHDLRPDGSTFRSAHGGELLVANDAWFAPTDVTVGPDGAVYVADWYDRRTAHPDPDATWDRSNGRVYKIEPAGTRPATVPDLRRLSDDRLVDLLGHRNDWFVRRARRLLTERRATGVRPRLLALLKGPGDSLALQGLWALHGCGGLDEDTAGTALAHRSPEVRAWAVRLLGDGGQVAPALAERLADLARHDTAVTIRCQLACTACRLPAAAGLALVEPLLLRDEDGRDPYLPLLLWWAVERHALTARARVLAFCTSPAAWKSSLVRTAILPRLVRRYAAEGSAPGYVACARLLESAPARERGPLLDALDLGLKERPADRTGPAGAGALEKYLLALGDGADVAVLRPLARLGNRAARTRALALAVDDRQPAAVRLALLEVVAEMGGPECVRPLLDVVERAGPEAVRREAVRVVGRFDRDEVADALLRAYPRLGPGLRAAVRGVLLGRGRWALAFLRAVDGRTLAATEVPVGELQAVAGHGDRRLDELVRKHWGQVGRGTPEERLAEVRRLKNDLRAGPGDRRRGRDLFHKHCGACHRLFDAGGTVGPDLTHANRKDRDSLLVSTVDPSAVVRREYLAHQVETTDGRLLTGLLAEQSPGRVTLVTASGERMTLPRARIAALKPSPVSLMPDNLLQALRPQELRDLFAYLQGDGPVPGKE